MRSIRAGGANCPINAPFGAFMGQDAFCKTLASCVKLLRIMFPKTHKCGRMIADKSKEREHVRIKC